MLIYAYRHVTRQAAVSPYRTERVIAKKNVRSNLKYQLAFGVFVQLKLPQTTPTTHIPPDLSLFKHGYHCSLQVVPIKGLLFSRPAAARRLVDEGPQSWQLPFLYALMSFFRYYYI